MSEIVLGSVVVEVKGNVLQLKKALADAKKDVVDFNTETGKAVLADFNKRLDEIGVSLKKLQGGVKQTGESFTNFTSVLNYMKGGLALLGIDASVRALVGFTKEVIHSTASLDTTATTIGTTTDALQAYRAAAVSAGQSIEASDNAIRFFTRSIGTAEVATGNQRAAFQKLGISARDLAGGSGAMLPRVATALLNISNVTARARLEIDLFGRSGQGVEPMLRSWLTPVDQMIAKFKEAGLIIDANTIKKASEFESAWQLSVMKVKAFLASVIFPSDAIIMRRLADTVRNAQTAGAKAQAGAAGAKAQLDEMVRQHVSDLSFAGEDSLSIFSKPPSPSWSQALEKYLASLRIASELARDTVDQRRIDEKIIAAATAKLQDQGDAQNQTVRSLEHARSIVGATLLDQIKQSDTVTQTAASTVLFSERIKDAQAAVSSFGFNKEFTSYLDKLTSGSDLKSDVESSLTNLSKRMLRPEESMQAYEEITRQLKEQVDLSSMSAENRERESTVLQIDLQFNRSISDEQKDQIRNLVAQRQAADNVRDAIQDIASETSSWLSDIRKGENVFDSLFKHMETVFDQALDRMTKKWLESAIGGGGGGGGGFLSSLFGGGGGGSWASGAGIASDVFITPGLFHEGGMVGSPGPSRMVRANLFANAPRYHNGLRPDERPAILQTGEQVLSRSQVNGGGGSLNINVSVNGARGNQEIQQMVMTGVKDGLERYDRHALPGRVASLSRDPKVR